MRSHLSRCSTWSWVETGARFMWLWGLWNIDTVTHTSKCSTWSWQSSGNLQGCPLWCHGRNRDPQGTSLGEEASCFSYLNQERGETCLNDVAKILFELLGLTKLNNVLMWKHWMLYEGWCQPPDALRDCISLSRRSSSAAFLSSSSCLLSSSAEALTCSYTHSQTGGTDTTVHRDVADVVQTEAPYGWQVRVDLWQLTSSQLENEAADFVL